MSVSLPLLLYHTLVMSKRRDIGSVRDIISLQDSTMSFYDPVTLLCFSIKEGDVSKVKQALASGVDPNGQITCWGQTRPLILAASLGHLDIITILLEHPDIDPNLTDGMFGNTALIEASITGDTDVVRLLTKDKR